MADIRLFDGTNRDYDAVVEVSNTVWPDLPETVAEVKHQDQSRDRKYMFERLVAEDGGRVIATGVYGESSWSHVPGKYFIFVQVRPDCERRGVGTVMYERIVAELAKRDPKTYIGETREDKPHGMRFLTKRGFKQNMRYPASQLDLGSFDPARFDDVSAGVAKLGVTMVTLAALRSRDPDWMQELYDLHWKIAQDIPSDDPPTRPSFETFRKRFDSPNFDPNGYFIAIHDGRYIGLTYFWIMPANRRKLYTGLTGVIRSHRRKGIATALKVRATEFARQYGASVVETDNEENNPMYSLNLKLGFKPVPAWLEYKRMLKGEVNESPAGEE